MDKDIQPTKTKPKEIWNMFQPVLIKPYKNRILIVQRADTLDFEAFVDRWYQ